MKKIILPLLLIIIIISNDCFASGIYHKPIYKTVDSIYNFQKLTVKLKSNYFIDRLFEITSPLGISVNNYFTFKKPENPYLYRSPEKSIIAEDLPDLTTYYYLSLNNISPDSAITIANNLNKISEIDIAYFEPGIVPPPATPDFSSSQIYLNTADTGLGYNEIKNLAGAKGDNVIYCDVEYATIWFHEDFDFSKIKIINPNGTSPLTTFQDHGAAAMGVANASENGFGVNGMVNNAEIYIAYPCYGSGSCSYNVAQAIYDATEILNFGDVLLLEQQTSIPYPQTTHYGPVEYYAAVFDVIKTATAKGIIVIEAGGNGGVNLDTIFFDGVFDRNVRNSGAIMVGAGSQKTNKAMDFSSYGNRIDLFANGENVTTAGYGDLYNQSTTKKYTANFGGTSSASALIAAAVTSFQGLNFALHGKKLSPESMRNILSSTGIMSTLSPVYQRKIGRMPNLKAAYNYILTTYAEDNNKTTHSNIEFAFSQYNNVIKILNWSSEMLNRKLSVYDFLGREVIHYDSINFDEIDISSLGLESGIYFISTGSSVFKFAKSE